MKRSYVREKYDNGTMVSLNRDSMDKLTADMLTHHVSKKLLIGFCEMIGMEVMNNV